MAKGRSAPTSRSVIGTTHPGLSARTRHLIDSILLRAIAAEHQPILDCRPPVSPLVYLISLHTEKPALRALYGAVICDGRAPIYVGSSRTGSRPRDHVRSLELARGLDPAEFDVSIMLMPRPGAALDGESILIDELRPAWNLLGGFTRRSSTPAKGCSNFDALHRRPWSPAPGPGQTKAVKDMLRGRIVRPIWPGHDVEALAA